MADVDAVLFRATSRASRVEIDRELVVMVLFNSLLNDSIFLSFNTHIRYLFKDFTFYIRIKLTKVCIRENMEHKILKNLLKFCYANS